MTDFFTVVDNQRACRNFADTPVPDDMIERVLRAATHAPSSENNQPWVFVVVRDASKRDALGVIMRELWEQGGREWTRKHLPPTLFADVDRGLTGGIAGAPVLVVVAGDTQLVRAEWLAGSLFPAAQNMLLAANALGLGSALTTLATARSSDVARIVNLPDHIKPFAVIPIGYPARPLGPPRRIPVHEKAWHDEYGNPWDAQR